MQTKNDECSSFNSFFLNEHQNARRPIFIQVFLNVYTSLRMFFSQISIYSFGWHSNGSQKCDYICGVNNIGILFCFRCFLNLLMKARAKNKAKQNECLLNAHTHMSLTGFCRICRTMRFISNLIVYQVFTLIDVNFSLCCHRSALCSV